MIRRMRYRSAIAIVCWSGFFWGLFLSGGPSRADEPSTQPATRPTTQPSNPEVHRQALAIIEQALSKYRAAGSYHDALKGRSEIVATDKHGQDVGQSTEGSATFAYAHPNRVALVTDDFSIHCDGRRLWLYTAILDQYTEAAAPDRVDFAKLAEQLQAEPPPHPVLHALDRPDQTFAELFPTVREFTAVTRAERGDRPGSRLAGVFDAAEMFSRPEPELVPFTLWFDEKTGLLGEIRIDISNVIRKELGLDGPAKDDSDDDEPDWPGMPKHVERAVATLSLEDVRLDADIPSERFVFKPEAGTEKVEKFNWDELMMFPDPQTLIGKPAPTFGDMGFDGKPLSLEGLQGRVVVLDFWATWCVPCVQSMPKIQKIADKFADQPVTVVGINQDSKGKDEAIKQFLTDKKITFRQFLDPVGKLGRKYRVAGIPCTFLIDRKGIVQAVHMGLAPDLDDLLAEQVETLLKGANLFDPAQLERDKSDAGQLGRDKEEGGRPGEGSSPP
jgi:thiol-disulfide isomerase/thioredoxin